MKKFEEFLEAIAPSIKYENHYSGESSAIMLEKLRTAYNLGMNCARQALDIINRLRYLSPETKQKIVEELKAWEKKKAEEWKKL